MARASAGSRVPTLAAAVLLSAVTVLTALVFAGKIRLASPPPGEAGTVFYVVAYHYGFAYYDRELQEIERIEVTEGDRVTLRIIPSQAFARETALAYSLRTLANAVGGLPAGDARVREKILEDFALGNVEHIVGIAAHPVYVTTDVAALLNGRPFREEGPRTLREAVERGDPAIKTVTFTARRAGAFDVLCVDSGMDGAGTCGWGHKWMVGREAFVVRPAP
jgi:hypothetical protein